MHLHNCLTGHDWRSFSHIRNRTLGSFNLIKAVLESILKTRGDCISEVDKEHVRQALDPINKTLINWDRHYVKNLRIAIQLKKEKENL